MLEARFLFLSLSLEQSEVTFAVNSNLPIVLARSPESSILPPVQVRNKGRAPQIKTEKIKNYTIAKRLELAVRVGAGLSILKAQNRTHPLDKHSSDGWLRSCQELTGGYLHQREVALVSGVVHQWRLPSHLSRNGIYVREREGTVALVCSFVGAFSGVHKTTPGFRDSLEGPWNSAK